MVVIDSFGYKYLDDPDTVFIRHSLLQYDVSGIRPEDIVIDIGANIGSFSFRVAKLCKRVYAIEPFRFTTLVENIKLNNITNVVPVLMAHGTGEDKVLEWNGTYKVLKTWRLPEIIKFCGGECDYLKVDTEGTEWTIRPEELLDIRRIELELHGAFLWRGLGDAPLLQGLSKHFKYTIRSLPPDRYSMWLHGVNTGIL